MRRTREAVAAAVLCGLLGPFVPQQFYCTGWGGAAYLLYKDVNRDVEV